MPNPQQSTNYRESAIEEMLGKPPGWLLHSGIGAIGVVLVVMLSTASFIRYPDKLSAPFLLQTETVPLSLHLNPGDIIDSIFVSNGDQVNKGDTLLVIRSSGDWRAVKAIATSIEAMHREKEYWNLAPGQRLKHLDKHLPAAVDKNYPIDVQTALTDLLTTLAAHKSYLNTNGVNAQIMAFQGEIKHAKRLSSSIKRQVAIQDEELLLEQQQKDRMTLLAADKVVSAQDAEQATARMLGVKRQQESLVSSDIQNEIRVQQLNQRILELRLTHQEKLAEFTRLTDGHLKRLEAVLNAYRTRYVLLAQETGLINWQPNIRGQALVESAAPIGFIMSNDAERTLVARLQLPAEAQGKASIGDKVFLELDGYPSREYGQVEGVLTAIDPVALPNEGNGYLRQATVAVPDSIVTSYGKPLNFQYNLSGTAQIVSTNRTLLQRLFNRFLNLTKNT